MAAVEEKTMVPTVLVGVGGTGAEVLLRARRLIEETYGSLEKLPVVSFLWIDTDKDYKVANPEAAGSPLKDNEKYWASVSGKEVKDMMSNMSKFPWIESWFPKELARNIGALEAGAGQIRACGRFALFYNYHSIKEQFNAACDRVKGHENFMQDEHGIRVNSNGLNVFLVASLSGGTGSGMLLDLGYCTRDWLKGQGSPLITTIAPMPNAFAGIKVGDRVLANGYAALMELSYFSDHRTEYSVRFSKGLTDEVRGSHPPFDFTYLVGTKNGEVEFNLNQLREMIAQNIFLDLTSDFAPHKRSIRDNIKGAWAQADPGGRGYPKNFMSFGLATIEIPVAQIRAALSNRLASDLIDWWINEAAVLPPNMVDLVQTDTLKRMRLTETELLSTISSANDKLLITEIAGWVNSIRNEIATGAKLQSTFGGANVLGPEKGNILGFLDYLQPKVDEYRANHLRELSPDERAHGDFLQKMYDNRNQIIRRAKVALEEELYNIISDRNRGPKFADAFITNVRQLLNNTAEKFRRESEKIYQPNEINRQRQYEAALQEVADARTAFRVNKQAQMEKAAAAALSGLEGSLVALIQRKARTLGLEVITRMQEHLTLLERRVTRLKQKFRQLQSDFSEAAEEEANQADVLNINGMKLYDRDELNGLYQDLVERLAGTSASNQSRFDLGLAQICSTMTEDILKEVSPLWKKTRQSNEVMRLLDITALPDVNYDDFKEKIEDKTRRVIQNAPQDSRLKQDLTACDRLFRSLQNDVDDIRSNIRIVHQKSQPLIQLSKNILMRAGFTPSKNTKVAIFGGRNTSDPAAMRLIPFLQERVGGGDAITPLGEQERHRIVFVQEIGGFSLRCINGMEQLQKAYQEWKGQVVEAKRAQLSGNNYDLPIPVHIQKELPFWDIFPEDPAIFTMVIQARALNILNLRQNRSTGETVVRYVRKTVIGRQSVDIASSWEEVVQVLEVQACRPDREAIQAQISAALAEVKAPQAKQALYEQLMAYLKQREADLDEVGGADSPEYRREQTVIQDMIVSNRLRPDQPSASPAPREQPTPPPRPQNGSASADGYKQLEQYLNQLRNLGMPEEAFIASARAKAAELGLDGARAEVIWTRLIGSDELTATERQYKEYLSRLATMNIPQEALVASARAKAVELAVDEQRAETIWRQFI